MDEAQIDLIRESFSSLVNHPCLIAICEPYQNHSKMHYLYGSSQYITVPPQSQFNKSEFNDLEDEFKKKIQYLTNLQGRIRANFGETFERMSIYSISRTNIQDEVFNLILKIEDREQCESQIELYLHRHLVHFEMSIQSLIEQMSSLLKN